MPPSKADVRDIPLLSGGIWKNSQADSWTDVFNPSTGQVIAQTPNCTADEVNETVRAAKAALASWGRTPVVERARVMFRFRELMEAHCDELAGLITQEHGKTAGEASAEMKRGIEMVEFACGIPSMIMGQSLANLAADVDAETLRHPVGVCVGITPYNFPSMVPLWMFPIAIVCGNTFILKPSEKVPLSAIRLGELLLESGLPDGVFNVAHGGRETVDILLKHPHVKAVSFVGSTKIAKYVYEVATQNGKRVQSAGGAKNHLIIMPDAEIDLAVKALAASAYGCAGQRCMAGSIAVAVGSIGDPLVDELCTHANSLNVGPTDGNSARDMGPLINVDAVNRVSGYLDVAASEGARVALDGRREFSDAGFLIGPSVVDQVAPTMRLAKEEVFGPLLSVIRTDDLEAAIDIGDQCDYGNGASIFTRDGYAAREFKQRFNAGMIGINVGVPAPMAWFPFTGWNQSFFGDLHIQGTEGVHFYTRQKTTLTRWFRSSNDSHLDPVWAEKGK